MHKIKNLKFFIAIVSLLPAFILVLPKATAITDKEREVVVWYCGEVFASDSASRAQCETQYTNDGPTSDMIYNFCTDKVGSPASGYNTNHSTCLSEYGNSDALDRENAQRAQDAADRAAARQAEAGTFQPAEIDCEKKPLTRDTCGIVNYLVILINFLSAVAMMVIVASVMIAGYQYMTARDNPGAVEAAKKRIVWAMVALAIFVFGYALLNFFVPGGVLLL